MASKRTRLTLVIGLAALVASCVAPPASPPSAFPGYPFIPAYSGNQCKTVLMIGDSLLTPVSNVDDVLAQSGRCATVINAAVNGSAPTGNLQGVDWASRLRELIDQHDPDIIVIEFVGNGFDEHTPQEDETWLAQLKGLQNLVDIAAEHGVPYVVIAPVAVPLANNLVYMNEFISWQQTADIAGATKIDMNPYLAPGNTYTEYMSFPDGVHRVRNDYLHLSDLGAYIEGYVIAAAIAPQWT